MNVLLADDDPSSRELLRAVIALDPNHELTEVSDGVEAWALLSDAERHFDAAILDLSTSPIDGLRLTEQIRASPVLRQLPIILCTATANRETVQRAGQLAIRHFIVKPCRKELLLAKLQVVTAEIAAHTSAFHSTAERMGLSPDTVSRLTSQLAGEVRAWLFDARQAQTPSEFSHLTLTASTLKRSADKLRLSGLSRRLSDVETKFATDFSTQYGEMLPPSMLEVASELVELQTELDRITAHFGLRG